MKTTPGHLARPFGRLYYEVTGSGPPIVFAHGLGGNHLSWWQQVAHFGRTHRCITFSHRGFAPSDSIVGGPDPEDYADDLAALIAHLEVDRPVLVAQSMGGWSCLRHALSNPDAVQGLMMACTTGMLDFRKAARDVSGELANWQARADKAIPHWIAADIHPACGAAFAAREPARHELYKAIDRLNAGLDKGALRQRLERARHRSPAELAKLKCPVLFLAGADDLVVPACGLEAVAAETSQGHFVCVPDAGHSVYFEHPALFNAELESFIAGLPT